MRVVLQAAIERVSGVRSDAGAWWGELASLAPRQAERQIPRMNAPKRHPSNLAPNMLVTPFERALRVIVPSATRREIWAFFGTHVPWSTIDHWRKGRARPPKWVVAKMRAHVAPVMAIEPYPTHGIKLLAWLAANGGHGPGRPKKEKAPTKEP